MLQISVDISNKYDILIGAITVDRLVDDIDVEIEKLPATTVKGKCNPVEVYNLVQAL